MYLTGAGEYALHDADGPRPASINIMPTSIEAPQDHAI